MIWKKKRKLQEIRNFQLCQKWLRVDKVERRKDTIDIDNIELPVTLKITISKELWNWSLSEWVEDTVRGDENFEKESW